MRASGGYLGGGPRRLHRDRRVVRLWAGGALAQLLRDHVGDARLELRTSDGSGPERLHDAGGDRRRLRLVKGRGRKSQVRMTQWWIISPPMNPLADCLAALSVIATGSSGVSADQLGSVAIDVYLVGRLDQGCEERLALVEC
jgi:hypothetical protein